MDKRIARIASAQKGIVTWAELRAAEITAAEIKHRIARGALIREYRGVYRVGHRAASTEASYLAAVKACGREAVLAGLAAAHLYGLVKCDPPPPEVAHPRERRLAGIRTRRRRMHPLERTSFHGIPILTVPAVLVDVAARLDPDRLARACHEAGVRYGVRPPHVQAVLDRRPNVAGATAVRRVMTGETAVTLSALERGFRALLVREGLPLPIMNQRIDTKRIDCRWPDHGVTVELDSYRFHNSRYAWEQDLRREREAHAREDVFRRFTWADVFEDPSYMLSQLRSFLA